MHYFYNKKKISHICIWGSILLFLCICIYIKIIINVNQNSYSPEIVTHKINEEVQLTGDYFFNEAENLSGYTIKINGTELLTVEEFKKIYKLPETEDTNFADYIYLIKVSFKNISGKDDGSEGLIIDNYMLQHISYMNYIDINLFTIINNLNSPAFYLNRGVTRDFILPFTVNKTYINEEEFKDNDTSIIISLYPHKNVIYLNKE